MTSPESASQTISASEMQPQGYDLRGGAGGPDRPGKWPLSPESQAGAAHMLWSMAQMTSGSENIWPHGKCCGLHYLVKGGKEGGKAGKAKHTVSEN